MTWPNVADVPADSDGNRYKDGAMYSNKAARDAANPSLPSPASAACDIIKSHPY